MSSVESRAGFKGAGANWAVAQGLHKKTAKNSKNDYLRKLNNTF